jgi:hypothetical protein
MAGVHFRSFDENGTMSGDAGVVGLRWTPPVGQFGGTEGTGQTRRLRTTPQNGAL